MMSLKYLKLVAFLFFLSSTCGSPIEDRSGKGWIESFQRLFRRDTYMIWNMATYPNPRVDFAKCGRPGPSNVCDPDRILTLDEANNLDFVISKTRNETICACTKCQDHSTGISIGIAIMKNMYHDFHSDLQETSNAFAQGLLTSWNFGQCNDDIVILLATENTEVAIKSGSAVDLVLHRKVIRNIFVDVKEHFTSRAFYQGLESLVNSIYDKLRMIQRSPMEEQNGVATGSVGLTVGLIVGFVVLAGLFAAGALLVRRRQQMKLKNKKTPAKKEANKSNIVKVPIHFMDTVYQPCSVEDPNGSMNRQTSDEELNFEDKYMMDNVGQRMGKEMADIHHEGRRRHELTSVQEETGERYDEEGNQDEEVVFQKSEGRDIRPASEKRA